MFARVWPAERLLFASVILIGLAGCGGSHSRYTPTEDEARGALETALKAWAADQPAGSVTATPPIRVVDSTWQQGRKLAGYEVLREENGDEGTKRFTVRLKLVPGPKDNGPAEQEATYVVHGRDPVWVFGEADYRRMLNMDNNAPPPVSSRYGRRS